MGKETINRVKRRCMEWMKVFSNQITGKRLISKVYMVPLQFNSKKKPNNPIKNLSKNMSRHFSKEDISG